MPDPSPGSPSSTGETAAAAPPLIRPDGHPIRALVVEDEFLLLMDLRKTLADHGADIVAGTGVGKEAVELARLHRPDVVVMDIRLDGEMDGIAAARDIIERYAIAVVFVSANADPATRMRVDALGGPEFVAKPARPDVLGAAVARAFERARATAPGA